MIKNAGTIDDISLIKDIILFHVLRQFGQYLLGKSYRYWFRGLCNHFT